MAERLDMTLDDIIKRRKEVQARRNELEKRRGRDIGPAPVCHFFEKRRTPEKRMVHTPSAHHLQRVVERNVMGETKLYVSNLDYGVSNGDIEVLFSDVGKLKRCSIHYDTNGRSTGTAEVVYIRNSDALEAVKRYNRLQLDGRPMHIEIIGDDYLEICHTQMPYITPSSSRPPTTGTRKKPERLTQHQNHNSGDNGEGHGRHDHWQREAQSKAEEGKAKKKLSAEELDADLENFMSSRKRTRR